MKKVIKFVILTAIFLFIGSIIWKKINHKSTEEIFQEKAERFYENQESFEKVVAYVSGFDFRSITENNEIRTDVMVDGMKFRLSEGMKGFELSSNSAKTVLSQLLNNDESAVFVSVIGESSSMYIYYDKKNYNNVTVVFSIKDTRLENIDTRLVWHNSDYEPMADWVYPLNENWTIIALGRDIVK